MNYLRMAEEMNADMFLLMLVILLIGLVQMIFSDKGK